MNEFDIERFRLQRQNQSLGGLLGPGAQGMMPSTARYRGGAIVWFKGGGPKMVVLGSDGMSICRCGWFAGAVFNQQNFHEDTLVAEDPAMTSVPVRGLRLNKKTGKLEKASQYRDASHAIKCKKSKRVRVVRKSRNDK